MGYDLIFTQTPKLSKFRILNRYCHEFICYLRNRARHRKMEEQVSNTYQSSYTSNK
jgi:hypothetical protein